MVGIEAESEGSEDKEEKERVRDQEKREEEKEEIGEKGGGRRKGRRGREPFPFQMSLFGAHSVRRRRSGAEEDVQKSQEEVGGGEWRTVFGEAGTAERLDRSQRLAPEKEGGGPTGKGVRGRMCFIGVRPCDGLNCLHKGDGRTEKEECGIELVLNAEEDGEGTECEGLETDGGVPAHVVSGEVCFWEEGRRGSPPGFSISFLYQNGKSWNIICSCQPLTWKWNRYIL